MPETREFGPLIYIAAEAIGQPGQRRFRLRTMNEAGETASLWLEKEQLNALGDAIETVLNAEGYRYMGLPLDDIEPPPVLPLDSSIEMRVAQLSMGVNHETQQMVLIAANGIEADDPDTTTLNFEFDYRRGHELQRQIVDVVAAGRPPCPLCTAPMDPEGHVCVRSNGHNPH